MQTEQPDANDIDEPLTPNVDGSSPADDANKGNPSALEPKAPEIDEPEQPEETPDGGEPKPEPENLITEKPEDAELPFHKHERWQEVMREKAEWANQRTQIEQQMAQVKPLAERTQALDGYLQQHNIPPQQFQAALEYLRLAQSDPAQAYQMFKPEIERLQGYVGEILPADLQAEVAGGTLSAERARELAQARGRQSFNQYREQTGNQFQAQQQSQLVNQSVGAFLSTLADPDLKPGTKLWKVMDSFYQASRNQNQTANPQQCVEFAKQAYKEAKEMISSFKPAPPIKKKPIASTSSNGNSSQVIRSLDKGGDKDIIQFIMAGKKPGQQRYS